MSVGRGEEEVEVEGDIVDDDSAEGGVGVFDVKADVCDDAVELDDVIAGMGGDISGDDCGGWGESPG